MAAVRLTDGQKAELVERFRQGAGLQELAEAYGCSPNTVSRTAKALLGSEDYERIKGERAGRRGGLQQGASGSGAVAGTPSEAAAGSADGGGIPAAVGTAAVTAGAAGAVDDSGPASLPVVDPVTETEDPTDSPGVLAIDDADDFGGDDDVALADDDGSGDDDGDEPADFPPHASGERGEIRLLPLAEAELPAAAWMLVDEKTVALQPRPLSEFPELGSLPAEELQRQALSLYLTQRQAKRLCGRSQRVIPIPDPSVFVITAPYLLRQQITRVVIEGALYALPGS